MFQKVCIILWLAAVASWCGCDKNRPDQIVDSSESRKVQRSADDRLVVLPGVGVRHICEIGMKWERFSRAFKDECGCADPEPLVELPEYGMTVYFTPTNKSGESICYMIAFKAAQKSAGTSASPRVKFEWSDAWEFRWDDVYARFGVPRNIPVEQLNVLGGSYPCSVVNQGEKCVHYAKEGIAFAGNVERDDVSEVRIMKKLDQDWDERIRDAGLSLGGER